MRSKAKPNWTTTLSSNERPLVPKWLQIHMCISKDILIYKGGKALTKHFSHPTGFIDKNAGLCIYSTKVPKNKHTKTVIPVDSKHM